MEANLQSIGCRVKKDEWRKFKVHAALAGDTNQTFVNKLIEAANRLDWSRMSSETEIKVVIVGPLGAGNQETEGLGDN